jgi:D-glycero-D-manno-heptose 1,7-bisphosphate phosphatase
MMSKPAIFLDRDGTLVATKVVKGKPIAINDINETVLIDGVIDSCKFFKKMNFLLILITNQPDVSKGIISERDVYKVNNYLKDLLVLDGIYVCFHDKFDNCICRKPKPGMLLAAEKDLNIDISKSFIIGDRASDTDAGYNAGCYASFLINSNYLEDEPINPYTKVSSIVEACEAIIKLTNKKLGAN